MSDHGKRPARAAGRVGPGEKLIRGDGRPADFIGDQDTEGHGSGVRGPVVIGPGEKVTRADETAEDFIGAQDTEGHVIRRPADGGE